MQTFKIRKINQSDEHGKWIDCVGVPDISGYWLQANGWLRNGSTYTKGNDVVRYDGTNWYLNGKEINNINEIPK